MDGFSTLTKLREYIARTDILSVDTPVGFSFTSDARKIFLKYSCNCQPLVFDEFESMLQHIENFLTKQEEKSSC